MKNADRVLLVIRRQPGISDGELVQATGVQPHQQVNQICRRLASTGQIERRLNADGLIGNFPVADGESSGAELPQLGASRPLAPAVMSPKPVPRLAPGMPGVDRALILIPCSGSKARGGRADLSDPSVAALLDPVSRRALLEARDRLREAAKVDESLLMPAWQRYTGALYAASQAMQQAVESDSPPVILSGGYGLVLATEPIGWYERRFSLKDWPAGLLADCLDQIVGRTKASAVVSFCSTSTGYGDFVRRYRSRASVPVREVTANMGGRGGAMVLVPRASGEALDAYLRGELADGWQSSDGLRITVR